ncbi:MULTISPECIES: STAS domain-containing protein [Streptomycetaceae]|jgi:anti-anti-sigma factor|uniref:STAS domain-containing protein n=1 Tax=Streptomycetaceae TaxID=2062 RepID=UPI003008D399
MDHEAVGTADLGRRLRVDVRQHGSSTVFTPSGELDHYTADLLAGPITTAVEQGATRLVVDCSGLEFCDSTGLNVLLGARLQAEAGGGSVHLAAMRPTVARVFEITGADAVFSVHETLDEALQE